MADAEDLKSSGDFSSWGFDSPPGHHRLSISVLYALNSARNQNFAHEIPVGATALLLCFRCLPIPDDRTASSRAAARYRNPLLSGLRSQHLPRRCRTSDLTPNIFIRRLLAQLTSRNKIEHLAGQARTAALPKIWFSPVVSRPADPEPEILLASRTEGHRGRSKRRHGRKERRLPTGRYHFSGYRRRWPPTGQLSRIFAHLDRCARARRLSRRRLLLRNASQRRPQCNDRDFRQHPRQYRPTRRHLFRLQRCVSARARMRSPSQSAAPVRKWRRLRNRLAVRAVSTPQRYHASVRRNLQRRRQLLRSRRRQACLVPGPELRHHCRSIARWRRGAVASAPPVFRAIHN
jgi:hypothetical protein